MGVGRNQEVARCHTGHWNARTDICVPMGVGVNTRRRKGAKMRGDGNVY